MMPTRAAAVHATILLALIAAGCATTQARIERGENFASAGIAYVDALPAVFDESFELAVHQNSLQLLQDRELFTPAIREEKLGNAEAELAKRLRILRDFRRHALLLREYFLALHALMANDAATGINSVTQQVVASLDQLRPGLAGASIGPAAIPDLTGPLAELAVGAYTNAALTRELQARGAVIERELALQKEMLDALVEDMADNAGNILQFEVLNPVFEEYVNADRVSESWSDDRVAAYRRTVNLDSYDDIRKAAASMHSSWVALVENRGSEASFELLLQDVEQLLAVARLFKSND